MIPTIVSLSAREIIDSRACPTIEIKIVLSDGSFGISSVPSGALIGDYEAQELRDNDPLRYNGMGVLKAIKMVDTVIAPKLIGLPARPQLNLDMIMINLDGTKNKSNLGANTTLGISQAICKAGAMSKKVSLFSHIADIYGLDKSQIKIPLVIYNLLNGGQHGAGNLDFQEFHLIPSGKKNFNEGLRMIVEIYDSVKKILIQYKAIHSVGDEGGFAPNLFTNLDALETLIVAIKNTPYQINNDVFFSIDVAASYFYDNGKYKIKDQPEPMSFKDFIAYFVKLNEQYNLLALEDPIDKNDWDGWEEITQKLPHTLIIGDDLLASNKERLLSAITKKACGAILVKPNQIGTVAETIEIIKIARKAGLKIIISHRSGETNDDFLADFAVGVGADYVKFGAPARGERVAKYNRLSLIENNLQGKIF